MYNIKCVRRLAKILFPNLDLIDPHALHNMDVEKGELTCLEELLASYLYVLPRYCYALAI